MDRDRFRQLVNDHRRTRDQVEQMWRNALANGEIELARIAETALDKRFPGWNKPKRTPSGATPTHVRFRDRHMTFPTAKEAYVWLISRFLEDKPEILESEDFKKEFVTKGRGVNYFARDKKSLFPWSPHLAHDPNFYTRLGNGWYADLNLNNRQKLQILIRFAVLAGYVRERDWSWNVQDGNEDRVGHLFRDL